MIARGLKVAWLRGVSAGTSTIVSTIIIIGILRSEPVNPLISSGRRGMLVEFPWLVCGCCFSLFSSDVRPDGVEKTLKLREVN